MRWICAVPPGLAALVLASCAVQERPETAPQVPPAAEPAAERAVERVTEPPPAEIETRILAAEELCEPSALLAAPWDGEVVLIADNEISRRLFTASIGPDGLVLGESLGMPGGRRPRDVEALAPAGGSLLAVGSHSRRGGCEVRTNRQRLRLLRRGADGSLEEERLIDGEPAWAAAVDGQDECLRFLFSDPPPDLAAAVCRALLEAEAAASPASCPVLNIEGAVGTPDGRVWLGLRAPLVDGSAALLRLTAGLDELRFDRVSLLELGERGVRELALDGETLYAIGGPPEDAVVPFALFSAGLDAVLAGGSIAPRVERTDLPPSSEGLLVRDGQAYIVIDGAEPEEDDETACELPSRHYRIALDRPPA